MSISNSMSNNKVQILGSIPLLWERLQGTSEMNDAPAGLHKMPEGEKLARRLRCSRSRSFTRESKENLNRRQQSKQRFR